MMIVWLLLIGVVVFTIWQVLTIRLEMDLPDEALYWTEIPRVDPEDDLLGLDLGARIFSYGDSRLVNAETPARFARWFGHERKTLALDWLAQVQTYVREIICEHRKAAAQSDGLNPRKEVELALQFLVFEAMACFLYCLILFRGPAGLSNIVDTLLSVTEKLRKLLGPAIRIPIPMTRSMKG